MDSITLAGFVTVVLLGGLNLVAVKFSNRGLPPFYGAGVLAASVPLITVILASLRKVETMTARSLIGSVIAIGVSP